MGVNAEETSPDMLKNTPSNIRRLANEIEQCGGRQKYLSHTNSPSDGGDVRWYFCKVPLFVNELAGSIPMKEIVEKGDYFRFGMRDSLAIEASFLQREDELLSKWWKEFAECSEGPRGQSDIISKSTLQTKEFLTERSKWQRYATEEDRVGVPVKGGLYEVDLAKRHCFPVYWSGENRRVLRGHWFARKGGLDWLPLREDISEQLEYAYRSQVWHRRTFQPSGLFAARVDLQGSTPGLHALFTGEDDTWESWLTVDASGVSSLVGFGGNGIKLRRGYASPQSKKPTQDELRQQKEEEMDDYCSQVPVRHLVFVVHGIGQRLEKSNLVDDVATHRHVTEKLAERHLTSHQQASQRVLFIPCQWRKGLTLGGEASVEKITLNGVRGLRTMLSATVHDILYYMSPVHCQDIIDSVSSQLNRLYLKFLKRNPGYDGKVSLYGHSLGSVLSYDILCHQEILYSPFPMEWMYKELGINDKLELNCSMSNLRVEKPANVETESIIRSVDNHDLVDEPMSGLCCPSGPPEFSESAESDSSEVCYQHTNDDASSNVDFVSSGNFNLMEPVKNKLENDRSICREPGCWNNDNNNDENISGKDKDETIKSMRQEIQLLRGKIKNLESECPDAGITKKTNAVENQVNPQSVHPVQKNFMKNYTPQIRYTKLEFKVDTFFAVGSPLGVFLSLRNVRIGIGEGKEYWEEEKTNEEMPACRRMFNIFHPCDPVAYRIEPLICKELLHKRPVIIPYHRGGKRLYIGFQEFTEGLASHSQALMDHMSTLRFKVLTLCESRHNDDQNDSEDIQEKKYRSYGSIMMERLTGSENGHIDHVLQDKTFRHPYVSAIGAHTNYWRDYDTILFMLKHLYQDIPEEPYVPIEQHIEEESSRRGWYDTREIADEELPLTFADRVLIKKFSHRAKEVQKS